VLSRFFLLSYLLQSFWRTKMPTVSCERKALSVFVWLLLVPTVFASATVQYTVTDLGSFDPEFGAAANAINSSGIIVGYSATTTGQTHAFSYSNGQMTDLGAFGGTYSAANAVNDSGLIAGLYYPTSNASHAFSVADSTFTDLGTLGGANSAAYGINSAGATVGYSDTSTGSDLAFVYSNHTMSPLPTLGGFNSYAQAINDSNEIIGYAQTTIGDYHAFSYQNGTITDLHTLGGTESYATAINSIGQVVGYSLITGSSNISHAVLYAGNTPIDLGTLGGNNSYATGINSAGSIVGYSQTTTDQDHAFFYSGGIMTDLNTLIPLNSGWELTNANAINNSGQIVGFGYFGSPGPLHAFLLSPVPEPTSIGILGLGALIVLPNRKKFRAS
jgi:probable HAF family extracellular repeat protein